MPLPRTLKNPLREPLASWAALALRLLLGGVLLVAGLLKVGDPQAFGRSIMAYQLPGLSWEHAQLLGLLMPWVEVFLGALLLLGLFTRTAALLSTFLMVVFMGLIVSVWARGISIDCGCFSQGGATDDAFRKYPWDVARDVALALAGLWLFLKPRSRYSLDGRLASPRA